jgi:hypothetical protein
VPDVWLDVKRNVLGKEGLVIIGVIAEYLIHREEE